MKIYNVLNTVKAEGISSVRYWLIEKIAGKRMIVLNAVIYPAEDEDSLSKFSGIGGLVAKNAFPKDKGIILESRYE